MYRKGAKLTEGKTKIIYKVLGYPDLVIVENKPDITKNDDPAQTRIMEGKAAIANETTCIVFEILKRNGIPVAYKKKTSDVTFVASMCHMLPLEVVVRGSPAGSFFLRNPNFNNGVSVSFETPVFELFLKTTNGEIRSFKGEDLGALPVDPQTLRSVDDPFIDYSFGSIWTLRDPKKSLNSAESVIGEIERNQVIPEGISVGAIENIARAVFRILEKTFGKAGLKLVDFKLEFGISPDGELLLGDVIDNDSWRLRTPDGKELSKQLFRDGKGLEEVKRGYVIVLDALKEVFVDSAY